MNPGAGYTNTAVDQRGLESMTETKERGQDSGATCPDCKSTKTTYLMYKKYWICIDCGARFNDERTIL